MHGKTSFADYRIVKVSGGNLLQERPLFCNQGKNLVISNRETCHLYSTTTGEHLSQLFSCDSPIITLQLNPVDENQLFAVTEEGWVTKYFFDSENEKNNCFRLTLKESVLKSRNVPKFSCDSRTSAFENHDQRVNWAKNLDAVKFLHAVFYKGVIYASWHALGEYHAHVSTFSIENGVQIFDNLHPNVGLHKSGQNFAIEKNILLYMSTNFIYVTDLKTQVKRKHLIADGLEITCIAMCKEESLMATGDTEGKIIVWRNIFEKYPLKDVYHWHTLPVRALAFSDHGAHMLSGGEENVLVKWSVAAHTKTFLPRVSSAIHHIAVSPGTAFFSMSTADSRIQVINMNLKASATIQHFSKWASMSLIEPSKILVQDPKTEALVLGGRTGHLQFLSTVDGGRFLYTFDVTNRNYLTRERRGNVDNVEVSFAKFTRCGQWLVTAESGANDTQLKFWEFINEKQEFSLNTDVDSAHGPLGLTCLEVSSNELAVTCGADDQFRLWGIVEYVHMQQVRLHWAQLFVGNYRSLPITIAAFTRDGSLVGIGFGPVLTLWDTNTNLMKASLTPPLKRNAVKEIHFGNHDVSHLVVTATDCEIICWNLVTLCMQWIVPFNMAVLVSDPNSSYMCAVSKKNNLFIFTPSSASPEFRLDSICDNEIVNGLFLARDGAPHLYFLTKNQELFCLGEDIKPKAELFDTSKLTPYTSQIAQMTRHDVLPAEGSSQLTIQPKAFPVDILNMAAHNLPPVSLMCKDVIQSLLLKVPATVKSDVNHEEDIMILDASEMNRSSVLTENELQKMVDDLFIY